MDYSPLTPIQGVQLTSLTIRRSIYNSSIALECSRPPGILRMIISILCLTAQSYCTARVEIRSLIRLSREQLQTVSLHGFYMDPPVRSHCTVVYLPPQHSHSLAVRQMVCSALRCRRICVNVFQAGWVDTLGWDFFNSFSRKL